MPFCVTHPELETEQACARCRRPFCGACLAELLGRPYCAPCKDVVVREMQHRRERNPNALLALLLAVIPYVLCQGILAPLVAPFALWLGLRSLAEARQTAGGSGRDMARAAIVISGANLALWLVGLGIGALIWFQGSP